MFMEKEAGYDAWFDAKVSTTLQNLQNGQTTTAGHDDVMDKVWAKLQAQKQASNSQAPSQIFVKFPPEKVVSQFEI